MESVTELLIRLANDYIAQGCHLQAAKCLQPACSMKESLPTTRATACVIYAQLLLDHFDNLEFAKQHLHQAERELRATHGGQLLLCEVFDLLARCHRYAAAPHLVLEAYAAGLESSTKGGTSKDMDALCRWRTYFLFCLADAHMAVGGPEASLQALEKLNEEQELPQEERALLGLCRAVAHLHSGDLASADIELTEFASVLEGMMEVDSGDKRMSELVQAMRAHYFLLYTAVAMAMGRAAHLREDAEIPVLMQLQEALAGVTDAGSGYRSLPPSAAAALGHLLHAALLRGAGKGSRGAVYLAQADEIIEKGLTLRDVDWSSGEGGLTASARVEGRLFVNLRAIATEQRALSSLLIADIVGAGRHAAELTAALQRFPTTLARHVPSAHMLLGHYAQATGSHAAALAHFNAALQRGPQRAQKMAALAAAACELQREGGDLSACAEYLESQGLGSTAAVQSLPANERATAHLVNGLLLHRQGDSTGARLLLTKALKQAHGLVGSTQLVGQVLNALAPVQQEKQDLAGAQQMFESATTLLKSIGDLPSLVTTLRGLCRVDQAGTDASRAAKSEEYMKRKAAELRARVAAATAADQHTPLLQWNLS